MMAYWISGELADWPSKDRMAAILRSAGLNLYVGKYAIRIEDCSDFVFQEYGGDLGEPSIDAAADTLEQITRDGSLVSDALARAGIKHRFEIYSEEGALSGYLHHLWPLEGGAGSF